MFGGGATPSPAGPATELTATVPLDHTAGGAAIDPSSHTLWIRGSAAGMVALDTTTRRVLATILLPTSPDPPDLEIDPATHLAYVPVAGPAVLVVDLNSRARIDTIRLPGDAHGVALDRQRKALYVAVQGVNGVADASALAVISIDTRQVTALIPMPMPMPQTVGAPRSFGVAVDTETDTVFVTNQGSGTVSMVDPSARRVTATILVGPLTDGPVGVAVDSATHQAYVAVYGRGIAVIDEESRCARRAHRGRWSRCRRRPACARAVCDQPERRHRLGHRHPEAIGDRPHPRGRLRPGVAVDPESGTVYVTDSLDRNVSILAAGKGTRTAPSGHASVPQPETPEAPPISAPAPSATANPSATALPAPNARARRQFKSPTGNIVCRLASTGAACEIRQHHYRFRPRPTDSFNRPGVTGSHSTSAHRPPWPVTPGTSLTHCQRRPTTPHCPQERSAASLTRAPASPAETAAADTFCDCRSSPTTSADQPKVSKRANLYP